VTVRTHLAANSFLVPSDPIDSMAPLPWQSAHVASGYVFLNLSLARFELEPGVELMIMETA